MILKDLREKKLEELKHMVIDQKSDLEQYIRDIVNSKEKNISKIRFMKKDIARIQTVIREKELN